MVSSISVDSTRELERQRAAELLDRDHVAEMVVVHVAGPGDVVELGLLALHRRQTGRVPEDRGRVVGDRDERLPEPDRARAHADLEERPEDVPARWSPSEIWARARPRDGEHGRDRNRLRQAHTAEI